MGFWCRTQDTMETLLRSHPCGTRSQSLARRGECWDCGCWIQDTVGTFLRSHSLTGRSTLSTLELNNLLLDLESFWDLVFGVKTPWKRFSGLLLLRDDFVDP